MLSEDVRQAYRYTQWKTFLHSFNYIRSKHIMSDKFHICNKIWKKTQTKRAHIPVTQTVNKNNQNIIANK